MFHAPGGSLDGNHGMLDIWLRFEDSPWSLDFKTVLENNIHKVTLNIGAQIEVTSENLYKYDLW